MSKKLNEDAKKQVVILIHGIRTRAWWQGPIKALVENEVGATVIPLKYGYFDLFRFWCPFGVCRSGPITQIHSNMRNIIHEYPDHLISVIAHSYGTFAVSRLLLENNDIRLHRLILSGSIIPNGYPWARISSQFLKKPMREAVINECGTMDIWPPLAKSTTWGYGNSGTNGFGSGQVTDRVHAMPHSGYLNKSFAKKYWVPFLKDGKIVQSAVESKGVGTPLWFSLLDLPWKWGGVVLLPVMIGLGGLVGIGSSEPVSTTSRDPVPSQSMSITGDNNTGTQTLTIPKSERSTLPSPSSSQVDENGNVIIQERIK